MPLPFAPNSVLTGPSPFWPTVAPGQLDLATVVIDDGVVKYRLVWELEFHDGKRVFQYTRSGDQIFQVYLTKLDKRGAKLLHVHDTLLPAGQSKVYQVGMPPGATPQVVYNSTFKLEDTGICYVSKVYTFGWTMFTVPEKREYHHIDPQNGRVVVNDNPYKSLPWD